MFGYRWWLAKALIFGLSTLQGFCVYLTVRRFAQDCHPLQREAAAVFGVLMLFFGSETFLVASSNDTGLVQSSAWLGLSVTLLVHQRPRSAGFFAGAAAMTSIQTFPLVAALGVVTKMVGPRRSALQFVLVALSVVLLVHAAAVSWSGIHFFQQVYSFHLAKIGSRGEGSNELARLFWNDWPLFVASAAGATILTSTPGKQRILTALTVASLGLFLGVMVSRPRVFYWYFLPVLFPAAVLAGLALALLVDTMRPKKSPSAATYPSRGLGYSSAVCLF